MHAKDVLGKSGEQAAAEYLESCGLRILDRNWRCAAGEIDIVAVERHTLVVAEVKARTSPRYGSPLEAVSRAKRARLRRSRCNGSTPTASGSIRSASTWSAWCTTAPAGSASSTSGEWGSVPLARTYSVALIGVTGHVVEVEADIANGLVGMILVGLPDTALREARDRIRAAITNSREEWPQRKITVGLSPASLPKRGSWFDLAARAGVFQRKHRGRWSGPSGDACSTQPRTRLRHPTVDRTVVTDLMWWPRIPHGKDRAARRDPLLTGKLPTVNGRAAADPGLAR